MLQAFQYTTKQSWLKFKDEKTTLGRIEMLYGLVGCIEIRYGRVGCIEFLYGLVDQIKNLCGLIRKKFFLKIVGIPIYQERIKAKDYRQKTHSVVQKCYMAQQAVQISDMAQQAVQKSYMAQQAVKEIYMAQYAKSFSKCCRHSNILRNNHG